ncbi:MAG: hypothetical protein IPL97_02240 [Niastella sp.]|nr:hypothetical protein [Niastella sp.]
MKKYILIILALLSFSACKSNKSFLERNDADKALIDAVKKISKDPGNEDATAAIPILYKQIQQDHLNIIASYKNSRDLGKWSKIIAQYDKLQQAYNSIMSNTQAFKLITPISYNAELLEAKESAASDFYNDGMNYLSKSGRDNARKAYNSFKKSDSYLPGYKDSKEKMNESYENAIVDVVINPVQDNSFFNNSGWGNYGYNYSNEYFQQTLLRDLQNDNNSSRYAARFYTDWQARRENINPDWIVNLILRNMDIPRPMPYTYSRNVSRSIEVGRDTSGHPINQTVYATVNITRYSFDARATMEVQIRDLETRRTISNRSFSDTYQYQQERGSFTGDSRALSASDWNILNNTNYEEPRKEEILNELYRKIYPQVLNNIKNATDW